MGLGLCTTCRVDRPLRSKHCNVCNRRVRQCTSGNCPIPLRRQTGAMPSPRSPRSQLTCCRCVIEMDHHCPVVSTCVGARNIRTFLAMVGTIIVEQLLFLHLLRAFCQRQLAPVWGVAPTAVQGWPAVWQAADMLPGLVILGFIQVRGLCAGQAAALAHCPWV